MRTAALLAMCVALPACSVSHAGVGYPQVKLTFAESLEQKTVAMVRWVAVDEEGNLEEAEKDAPGAQLAPYCSGVWVNDDTFVTAEHCVDDLGKPSEQADMEKLLPPSMLAELDLPAWDPTGQPLTYSNFSDVGDVNGQKVRRYHDAYVFSIDKDHDLALVRIKDAGAFYHGVAQLATDCHVGDDIHIMGHPAGLWWSYFRGVVAAIRPRAMSASERPVDAIQVSAPVWFGNSGGGAYNGDGQLIGIASWIRKVPNTGFFIRYDVVNDYLNRAHIRRD